MAQSGSCDRSAFQEASLRVFRISAVNAEGRTIVLGTVDTPTEALAKLRDALGGYQRAWVSDEFDEDVAVADLILLAQEEQS